MSSVSWDVALKYIQKDMICVECGVMKGKLSKKILERNPKKLYLIDPWRLTENMIPRYGNRNLDWDNIYYEVCNEFYKYKNVVILRDTFQNALPYLKDNTVDLITYDTLPIEKERLEYIKLAIKKVKVGGYIIGYNFISNIDKIMELYKDKLEYIRDLHTVTVFRKI